MESWERVEYWINEIYKTVGEVIIYIIGTKNDLETKTIHQDIVEDFIKNYCDKHKDKNKLKIQSKVTSSKTGEGVNELMEDLIKLLISENNEEPKSKDAIVLNYEKYVKEKKCC